MAKRYITHPTTGETLTLKDWSQRLGITGEAMHYRVTYQATGLDRPITPETFRKPALHGNHNPKLYECRGESMTITEWAERLGTTRATLLGRLGLDWTLEETLGFVPRKKTYTRKAK